MLAGYAYSGSAEDSYKQLYPNLSYKLSLLWLQHVSHHSPQFKVLAHAIFLWPTLQAILLIFILSSHRLFLNLGVLSLIVSASTCSCFS
jgi:hypothetical protein